MLDQAAREAVAAAVAEDDDVTGIRTATDAIALPLQQLAREAESLASSLKEASNVAGAQQGRIQDLAVSANSLAREAARATANLTSIRVGTIAAENLAAEPTSESSEAQESPVASTVAAA